MAFGDARGAIAIRHHFALLGEAEPAVNGVGRLGEDGAVGGAAAAADGAAAAVEDLDAHAGPPRRVRQGALRLIKRPGRLQKAGLLVAVRVADHDFLHVAAQAQVLSIDRLIQQPLHDHSGGAERLLVLK